MQVGYAAFRDFVVSREAGLREAFSQFDLGEQESSNILQQFDHWLTRVQQQAG
jgi:hypothetical protein